MFRFRKRIKILPGVHLNVGKQGINSVSVGPRGATVGISKRCWTQSIATPIPGLSYRQSGKWTSSNEPPPLPEPEEPASRSGAYLLLLVCVLAMGLLVILAPQLSAAKSHGASNTATHVAQTAQMAPTPEPEVRRPIPVEPEVRKAIPVTKAEKGFAAVEALGSKREALADYNTDTAGEAIERINNAGKDDELRYTISSTGKRHNSTCRYYGKGRPAGPKEGIPCKICGG